MTQKIQALRQRIEDEVALYSLEREQLATSLADQFSPQVEVYDGALFSAIIACGAADRGIFAPLGPAAVKQIEVLNRTHCEQLQPHLRVLSVANMLSLMGISFDSNALACARNWLAGMQSAGTGPEWMRWERGLAALALNDMET